MRFNDPELVRREYASEQRFVARKRVHTELRTGVDPDDMILRALEESAPTCVLEVGCGTGELAQRIAERLRCRVVALDLSPRMVELARRRGVEVHVGDVQELPLEDASFDCVVAAWMLYHVPDLDRGLAEIVRVLRPAGRLVASTLAEDNLVELWRALGDESPARELAFNGGNGAAVLRRHFARVERRQAAGEAVFPTHDSVREYVVATITGAELAERATAVAVPFRARSDQIVFVAEKAT